MAPKKVRVLFVCLGNICRSPAAEGTFRHLVDRAGVTSHFEIDSAGTGAYHVGEPPNSNARRVAAKRGITLEGRARQFVRGDFSRFDYILTMDRSNHGDVLHLAEGTADSEKVFMFRRFDPQAGKAEPDVPDPYYGGLDGFEQVQDIMFTTGQALLEWLAERHHLPLRDVDQ